MENPWTRYSERTKDKPPRELLVQAVTYVQHKGHALDLGPGALNESKYLLEQGFQSVVAVNRDPLETDPVAHRVRRRFQKIVLNIASAPLMRLISSQTHTTLSTRNTRCHSIRPRLSIGCLPRSSPHSSWAAS
jgi:hypothetical protein